MIKKICLLVLFLVFILVGFLWYQIKFGIKVDSSVTLFVIDDNKSVDEHKILQLFLLGYFPEEKKLNILFINDNLTIIQKKIKSRTLNENYYLQKESRCEFIKGELKKIFGDDFNIDGYINVDINDLKKIMNLPNLSNEKIFISQEFQNNLFYNNDYSERIVYCIKFIKNIAENIDIFSFFKIINFIKDNNSIIKTDNTSVDINLLKIYYLFRNIKDICFVDISTVVNRNRLEINEQFINPTKNIFLNRNIEPKNKANIKLKVLNASGKQRMAIKAADKIRSNGFDVFEWGGYNKEYDYTVIIDSVGNLSVSNDLINILGCGEILCRLENKRFEDVTVILGKDCTIYDKLDGLKY